MHGRRLQLMIVSMLLLVWLFGTTGYTASVSASRGNPSTDEVMIKLYQATDLAAVAAQYQLNPTPIAQFGSRSIYRLRIIDGAKADKRADQLARDKRVEYAEPNYAYTAPESSGRIAWSSGGDTGTYVAQWAGDKIRLPLAKTISNGAGVTVAVLDTGVDATHPALIGHLLSGYDFVDLDNDPSEQGTVGVNTGYGHGTHVAGLVALAAPAAKIMPLRVLDPDGMGNAWVLIEALKYAVDPDANPATDDGAHVINMSLSTVQKSKLLEDVLQEVTCVKGSGIRPTGLCQATGGRGAVVVAAAGNSGSTLQEYPAAFNISGLIAVAASTQSDQLATTSTIGSWVDVAAPGENILSSVPGGGYGTWSGTSMAAPLVAGEVALVRAVVPMIVARDIAIDVQISAVPLSSTRLGRVDAARALGLP